MPNTYETINVHNEGRVVHLILNRPEQHNALNRDMVQELIRFFSQVSEEEQVLVVTMRGAGKSFCSGADLLWMKNSALLTDDENLQETLELSEMFETIHNCRKVVIGMAHGNIFGGGNGLLAACDLAYCTHDSRFSLSETRIGLAAATISPYLLYRMSPATVKELVFTADRFDGRKAEATGLVNCYFATSEEMEASVAQTIDVILKGGPKSILASKKLTNQLSGFRFPEGTSKEMARILAELRVSAEAQEGMKAFTEKRKPLW
jgi:methylglutaconyl-CoA hydratase